MLNTRSYFYLPDAFALLERTTTVLSTLLIALIVATTVCAVAVWRHNRRGAVNRAFVRFAATCLFGLALPLVLREPLSPPVYAWLLLLLYGVLYLFAPTAFIALLIMLDWSGLRRRHRLFYRSMLITPIVIATVLFMFLCVYVVNSGRFAAFMAGSTDTPFQVLIAGPFDQVVRRAYNVCLEIAMLALLVPRAVRSRTHIERHTALVLLAFSILTSGFARFAWFSTLDNASVAGAIVSAALAVRLIICGHLLLRYRLFSRTTVGSDLALQHMSDGFIVIDEQLRVQSFNPAATKLLPDLVKNAPLPSLILNAVALPLDQQPQTVRIADNDRSLSVACSPIFDRRKLMRGAVLLLRDITHQEALLASRAEVAMLQKLNNFKADVIRTLQHELRTPLTAILGYSGALLVHETSTERREFLETIRRETKRLVQIMEDFLDMSSIQAGNMHYTIRPLQVPEHCALMLERFSETSATHPITVALPEDLPMVLADAERFDQVLSNLISNAIKYSPNGGPVHISAEVWDHGGRDASIEHPVWVCISVNDRGLGVPNDALELIFERFFRIQEDARLSIRGTGLGLAICKEIVQVHGGSIWAENNDPEPGSTFYFTLPAVAQQELSVAA